MKKYGDDADSFHDQGTRVEASNEWYKQNQPKHNYSYSSSPKHQSRNYNSPSYKLNYSNNFYNQRTSDFINCQDCGERYNKKYYLECPNCKKSKPKTTDPSIAICSSCGKKYNKFRYSVCPQCMKPKPKFSSIQYDDIVKCPKCGEKYDKKYHLDCPQCKSTQRGNKIIILCLALILFLIIILIFFI